MSIRHPSKSKLAKWLDTGEPASVARHLERCDRCATVLERLTLEDAPGIGLESALSEALTPPEGFEARVRDGLIAVKPQADALRAVLDLFGSGWETMRMLAEGDEDG